MSTFAPLTEISGDPPPSIISGQVALKEDGSVVWLDKGKGSWRLRTKTRDLVFYRDYFLNWNGKRIFAAKLLDNSCDMYLEGEIKGWGPFQSLDTLGSFQAVRRYEQDKPLLATRIWRFRDVKLYRDH